MDLQYIANFGNSFETDRERRDSEGRAVGVATFNGRRQR
jgi:hypothetical protein